MVVGVDRTSLHVPSVLAFVWGIWESAQPSLIFNPFLFLFEFLPEPVFLVFSGSVAPGERREVGLSVGTGKEAGS